MGLCVVQVPFWAKQRFRWTTFNVSTLLAFAGIILIVIQTLGVRVLIPRYGEYRVLSVAMPTGILQFALFGEWRCGMFGGCGWAVDVACVPAPLLYYLHMVPRA
jgi:hypothetical protein